MTGEVRDPIADADRPEPIAPGSAAFHEQLADVLRQAGTSAFYDDLARLVAALTGCRTWLVMRYAAYDTPVFLVNRAMTERACALYLNGLYRLDPLHRLARTKPKATVLNINQLDGDGASDETYLNELFRSAFIYDELAVLLPVPGGITVAVCCERRTKRFVREDLDLVGSVLPVIEAIHGVHLERSFAISQTGDALPASLRPGDAHLIVDERGARVFASDGWKELETDLGYCGGLIEDAASEPTGHVQLNDAYVLHWERLAAEFALAPNGTILRIERNAPGPVKVTARDAVSAFQEIYKLTRREVEIVELVLKGYPNERIADHLGISIGTVKNHRWRLYLKLDITSERELFYLFLSAVLDVGGDAPVSGAKSLEDLEDA